MYQIIVNPVDIYPLWHSICSLWMVTSKLDTLTRASKLMQERQNTWSYPVTAIGSSATSRQIVQVNWSWVGSVNRQDGMSIDTTVTEDKDFFLWQDGMSIDTTVTEDKDFFLWQDGMSIDTTVTEDKDFFLWQEGMSIDTTVTEDKDFFLWQDGMSIDSNCYRRQGCWLLNGKTLIRSESKCLLFQSIKTEKWVRSEWEAINKCALVKKEWDYQELTQFEQVSFISKRRISDWIQCLVAKWLCFDPKINEWI